jgi:hypothetical protein
MPAGAFIVALFTLVRYINTQAPSHWSIQPEFIVGRFQLTFVLIDIHAGA